MIKKQLYIAGNWKMHGDAAFIAQFMPTLRSQMPEHGWRSPLIFFPPALFLTELLAWLQGTAWQLGAQDVSAHSATYGAYTGEISAAMLASVGCRYTLVGHSERRQYHGETHDMLLTKTKFLLEKGIKPVLCIGETAFERESGHTESVLTEQLEPFWELDAAAWSQLLLAYEPVWAIGTGCTASPEMAQEAHAFIRKILPDHAKTTPLLYGGSVKADNAKSLLTMPDIDGALIGGASLKAEALADILHQADALLLP
jgi:triosephosphate isomerase